MKHKEIQDALVNVTYQKVATLQKRYLANESDAVRSLALLRGSPDGSRSGTWELVFDDLPEELLGGRDDALSDAEASLAAALQMYAIHQQGRRGEPMHQTKVSLGAAVRRLMAAQSAETATMARFKALGAAPTWNGQLQHLRGLINQLRGESIPIDYALLARDLYRLRQPALAYSIRQRWGRDVHRRPAADSAVMDDSESITHTNEGEEQ